MMTELSPKAAKYLLKLDSNTNQIETNLTDEEKAVIAEGRQEYKKGGFIPLDSLE